MAKPASVLRARKVLSSGRLTGSGKPASGGETVALRKVACSNVDCGYSLYSTDSEDQVTTIHHGLDRCAALLKDILQNDSEDGMGTVCRKAGKAIVGRTTSRSLFNKGSVSKKRVPKKKTLSAHKEIGPVSDGKLTSVAARAIQKGTAPKSTEQAVPVSTAHVPSVQHSPVIHEKLCEHIQTQMSLLKTQLPQKANDTAKAQISHMPENVAFQPVTAFNSRLPTSTPALSPQHTAKSEVIQPVVSMTSCAQCASQIEHFLSSAPRNVSTSISQTQPVASCSVLPHTIPYAPNDPPASAIFSPCREVVSGHGSHEQQVTEADLIKCIQAHLAALRALEKKNGNTNKKDQDVDVIQLQPLNSKEGEETTEDWSESSLSEKEDLEGVDMAPVRDTSCQTSFDKNILKPENPSLQKTAQKNKPVKYLLGEIKALLTDHEQREDPEILRLLSEVEGALFLWPEADGNINVQAEIALAVQPLRSENAQLRRRLRILNQQLKDQDRAEKEYNFDNNFEFVSIQALNKTLQHQLTESMNSIELLHKKNNEVTQILESQNEENKRLTKLIHEKEQGLLEKKQQHDIEITKLKIEADEMLTKMKTFQYKFEAAEKENQILGITLRQRDAEVNRLCELTRALQGSMSKLLADLTVDTTQPKQERSLSKALLEIHEKQLQSDVCPLSDSIVSYLKKLESDDALVSAEPLLAQGERKEPGPGNPIRATPEESPPKNPVVMKEIVAPKNIFTFLKPDFERSSGASTLVEGHEPDETIYIPLSSSPSQRRPVTTTEKKDGGQHQLPPKVGRRDFGLAGYTQTSQFGVIGTAKFSDPFSGSCCPKMVVENKAETIGRPTKLEEQKLHVQPKEIANGAGKVISDNPDRLHPDKFLHTAIFHQKGNMQGNGTGISAPDSSFSALDWMSGKSDWTFSSLSTFTSRDEEDFKNGLAALDANIARLQRTLQKSLEKPTSP